MSESKPKYDTSERTKARKDRLRRGGALVLTLASIYGLGEGAKAVANHSSHENAGPDKVYIAKPHDTEWTIAERAFPNVDPRSQLDDLDAQLPHDDAHKNHTVQPGDKFILPGSSEIGTPTRSEK